MNVRAKLKFVDVQDPDAAPDAAMQCFITVKTRDLFPSSILPCDFYFPVTEGAGKGIVAGRLLEKGLAYNQELRDHFAGEEIDQLYIMPEDEHAFLRYLNIEMQKLIKSPDIPTGKKTELLYDYAETVVGKVFRERPNRANILLGKQLVGDLALHLTTEHVSVKVLLSLFSKDYYTYTHSVQVAMLGMSFCSFLGWSIREVTDFGIGALFHDVGKSTISESILNKPGKLDREEFEIIKTHSDVGYHQLGQVTMLTGEQLDIVRYHHEAMDGSGYPDGLFGTQIPRYARLTHVVDVFDALTSERVYKKALSQPEAFQLMSNAMYASFDDEFLISFSKYLEAPLAGRISCKAPVKIDIGTSISLQIDSDTVKLKSVVIGREEGEYLILRATPSIQERVTNGAQLTGRFIRSGQASGFRATVTGIVTRPFPVLFLTYPKRVEKINLRGEERTASLLPAKIEVRRKECRCIMMDLSAKGCKLGIRNAERKRLPLVLKDEVIRINSRLPGYADDLLLEGTVRWLERGPEATLIGVRFLRIPEQVARALEAHLGELCCLLI